MSSSHIPVFSLDDMSGGNLASVLVQPVSAHLAKTLLSAPASGSGGSCVPIAMPSNAGNSTMHAINYDSAKTTCM